MGKIVVDISKFLAPAVTPVLSILLIGLLCVIADHARAEYRVFQLVITNTTTGQPRVVLSTLDDIQYPGYFHLGKNENIAIQETWMCWRRSDVSQDLQQKYCPNPRSPASLPSQNDSGPSTSSAP